MTIRTSSIALACLALVALEARTPAHAETAVKVSLTGESGGWMGMDLSASSAPAGKVRFEVVNAASSTGHEMIVVKLAAKVQKLPLNPAKHRIGIGIDPVWWTVSGLVRVGSS